MFQIFDKESCVGTAQIQQEGLYYRIYCNCKINADGIHRVIVRDGESAIDLGICVPEGNQFALTSRVPIKKLNADSCIFSLVKQGEKPSEHCSRREVPVETGKPFPALDELENGYFTNEDVPMVVIDPIQDPQDNDRNPEHL